MSWTKHEDAGCEGRNSKHAGFQQKLDEESLLESGQWMYLCKAMSNNNDFPTKQQQIKKNKYLVLYTNRL